MKTEYRIIYKRTDWLRPQLRLFQSASYAQRFLDKLEARYLHLAPIEVVEVSEREVGEWLPMSIGLAPKDEAEALHLNASGGESRAC